MTRVGRIFAVVALTTALLAGWSIITVANDVTFCFFDTDGLADSSNEGKFKAVADTLADIDADVVTLASVQDETALKRLADKLDRYPYSKLVVGPDPQRHLAMLAKISPERFATVKDGRYNVKSRETNKLASLPTRRGFAHALFNFDGYRLHVIGAHLKSREKHPEFNQTDMRRYEARLLRYYVTDIMKNDPDANILVMGNLNDTCGKSPIKDVYNRRFGVDKRLFDARPLDQNRTSWTCWNAKTDSSERIDYAIVSSSLVPEIVRKKTRIHDRPDWFQASSHRPIIVTIRTKDVDPWTKEALDERYPNTIYEGGASHFEADKLVGDKRRRKSPEPPAKKK